MENTPLLILILAALIFTLVLIYRLRKILSLAFIRIIYGTYSYEFLTLYKSLYVRSPFQYCFRDEFISHVLFILDKRDDIPVYKTFKEISFEDQPFFSDYKDFLKQKGKPYCFNAFSLDNPYFEIKILGYREFINDNKAIAAYYFIDDTFFMGEYIFKEATDNLADQFIRKFYGTDSINEDNFYLVNTQERIIHYQNNGFSIDIKFLSRENQGILSMLKAYHDNMTSRELIVEA